MPLTPVNECGVPKFVCTTLRPSLPPCPELGTLESCAKFVSEFLLYEPLANPLHPPSHFPSPMSVLAWQTADAFDASVVLCSLLLGAGYNAFVVMGYAPLAVTLNDQSQVECPLLGPQQGPWWMGTASNAAGGSCTAGSGSSCSTAVAGKAGSGAPPASSCCPSAMARPSDGGKLTTSAAPPADEPGKRQKYQARAKPDLLSKFLQQHPPDQQSGDSEDGSKSAPCIVGGAGARMPQVCVCVMRLPVRESCSIKS